MHPHQHHRHQCVQVRCLACIAALNRDLPGAVPGDTQLELDALVCVLAHQATALHHARAQQPLLPNAPAARQVHAAVTDCLVSMAESAQHRQVSMAPQLVGLLQSACAVGSGGASAAASAALAQLLHCQAKQSSAGLGDEAEFEQSLMRKVQALLQVRRATVHPPATVHVELTCTLPCQISTSLHAITSIMTRSRRLQAAANVVGHLLQIPAVALRQHAHASASTASPTLQTSGEHAESHHQGMQSGTVATSTAAATVRAQLHERAPPAHSLASPTAAQQHTGATPAAAEVQGMRDTQEAGAAPAEAFGVAGLAAPAGAAPQPAVGTAGQDLASDEEVGAHASPADQGAHQPAGALASNCAPAAAAQPALACRPVQDASMDGHQAPPVPQGATSAGLPDPSGQVGLQLPQYPAGADTDSDGPLPEIDSGHESDMSADPA